MIKNFEDRLSYGLDTLSIQLTDYQMKQFYQYYELLIDWNKVMNLTAITEMEDVVTKHFIDSLSMIKAFEKQCLGYFDLIDIGTGAGFPGIPLKIVFPDLKITLLDSLNKRIKFLNEVIEKIELRGIKTIHGRAEDFGKAVGFREQYDICVSRAVANLSTLSEYCLPYVKIGGCFISYKSGKIEEELTEAKSSLKKLGGKVDRVETFVLPETDVERCIVKIIKVKETPKIYPRKAGLPAKEPLH